MHLPGKANGLLQIWFYILFEALKVLVVHYAFIRSPYLNGFDFMMARTLMSTFLIGMMSVIFEINVFIANNE